MRRPPINVALCQVLVIDGDREGNFRRIEYALETARAGRAEVSVFPESSILGWENPDAHELAARIPGADSERISDLVRKYGMMIAIGVDEKDRGQLYDSAILVDTSGALLLKHRKINVLPELMTPPYAQGKPEDIDVAQTPFGRIGLVICADTFTDDHFDRIRQLIPDLLLVPYGWAAETSDWPAHAKELEALVTRRAAQIRCPTVGVNLVGEMTHGPWKGRTYGGARVAVDSEGRVLRILRDRDVEVAVVAVP